MDFRHVRAIGSAHDVERAGIRTANQFGLRSRRRGDWTDYPNHRPGHRPYLGAINPGHGDLVRILIVLSFLRTAMGTQQTPPNQVLISLALFLSLFVMMPTIQTAYDQGIKPLIEEEIDELEAFQRVSAPFSAFMMKHVREQDLKLFVDISGARDEDVRADKMPLRILIPAFMISELRRAFEIGFLIFVPFLIIDMVVASVLMAMGMMMLPPIIIALPFKIIFFVLVDGWYMVVGSLVRSFGGS
jgi:flagellar biosynthetic protein FliP